MGAGVGEGVDGGGELGEVVGGEDAVPALVVQVEEPVCQRRRHTSPHQAHPPHQVLHTQMDARDGDDDGDGDAEGDDPVPVLVQLPEEDLGVGRRVYNRPQSDSEKEAGEKLASVEEDEAHGRRKLVLGDAAAGEGLLHDPSHKPGKGWKGRAARL